jgi:hypothetical protein
LTCPHSTSSEKLALQEPVLMVTLVQTCWMGVVREVKGQKMTAAEVAVAAYLNLLKDVVKDTVLEIAGPYSGCGILH